MFIQMSSPCKGLKEDGKGTNFRFEDLKQKGIQYDTVSSNITDVGKSPVSRLKRKDGKRFLVSCVGRSFRVFLGWTWWITIMNQAKDIGTVPSILEHAIILFRLNNKYNKFFIWDYRKWWKSATCSLMTDPGMLSVPKQNFRLFFSLRLQS